MRGSAGGGLRRALVAVAAALAVTAGLGACALVARARFVEPVVTLRSVTVTGIGFTGGDLEVELSVFNPNAYALDAVRFSYRLEVDSTVLGEGALDRPFVVTRNDSSTVRLPVRFTFAGLGAAGRGLLQAGAVTYRVRGDFTVGTPLGTFTRPYDRAGRYTTMAGNRR